MEYTFSISIDPMMALFLLMLFAGALCVVAYIFECVGKAIALLFRKSKS